MSLKINPNHALKDKIDGIIANYRSSSILDFTGTVFEYDLNYFRLACEVITQGKRTGVPASLYNLPTAITNVTGKVAMGYYDTGIPNGNGCSKLWYCEGQSNGITCWDLGYIAGTCDGDFPPTGGTGSDSGYDSSGAYQSGGAPLCGGTLLRKI